MNGAVPATPAPRGDTHVRAGDTHVRAGDTHARAGDAHPQRSAFGTPISSQGVRDTHLFGTPISRGHPSRGHVRAGDTHARAGDARAGDTHVREDTHVRGDTHVQGDTHVRAAGDTHGRGTSSGYVRRAGGARRLPGAGRGFVLIATLWTLAAMAVLAGYIDGVASADIERAVVAKAALERELGRRSTESTLAYLLSTGRMNHRGLMLEPEQSFSDLEGNRGPVRSVGVIAASGETYAGPGGTRFSIQDENGLLSVNYPRSANFAAALSWAGVAAADIARIVPRAEDYVDTDNDLSLSGAEGFDYERTAAPTPAGVAGASRRTGPNSRAERTRSVSGGVDIRGIRGANRIGGTRAGPDPDSALRLSNPSNWIMASPHELRRVLGVDDVIAAHQWRRLLPMLTMRLNTGYNFNTMRPDVLAIVLDLDEAAVANILAERAERPVVRLNHVAMLTGTHADIDPALVQGVPSSFLRISIWHNAGGLRSLAGMALTPYGDAPWRIDYRYTESMPPAEPPAPAPARGDPTGAHRDPTEPAIDNESSDAGFLQAATPLLQ